MTEIVKPFELVYKLMTTKFKLIDSVNYNSPFILMAELSCTSPWQLFIVESKLELVNSIVTPVSMMCVAGSKDAIVDDAQYNIEF